ncbi:hypothetical protein AAIR29_13725, partial [Psychrobacter sp. FBL11]
MSQSVGKANLPNIITDDTSNGFSNIKQFLAEKGIDAQLGALFSIYENTKNNNNYIFYGAFAESADTKALGEYVPIDSIAE